MLRGIAVVVLSSSLLACVGSPEDVTGPDAGDGFDTVSPDVTSSCTEPAATYTPYAGGSSPSGTVAQYPWRGTSSTYPNGDEAFAGYGTALPTTVECSSAKSMRTHLDVTAGCLSAVAIGSYTRGQIQAESDDAFRMVALGHTANNSAPVKWTDTGVQYRFYYSAQHGTLNNPGFKAFLRYRTEDDLYVASWRTDGVVQIQRKQCGIYTPLKILPSYGAPSKNAWHTLKFTAVGPTLTLTLDGKQVIQVNDSNFSWGTAGIRVDAMDGAYLDDWQVFAP